MYMTTMMLVICFLMFTSFHLLNLMEFYFFIYFLNLDNFNFNICFIADFYSIFFSYSVLLITFCVINYSLTYMSGEIFLKRFLIILMTFVSSMILLIVSGNFFTAMIGWDGLGFSSLILVIYYYSPSALKAGLITFICNRVGDVFMILSVCLLFLIFPFYSLSKDINVIAPLMVLITAITKSAQIPFSPWLPAAMAAPTPISSLVHSSTLVTAGVYLLFRFNLLWKDEMTFKLILSILALSTMVLAMFCAVTEWDIKKVIAFSTLSQLGIMMFCLSTNLLAPTFFHLINHAFIKALLFMTAGYVIHNSSNTQDARKVGISYLSSPVIFSIFIFSSLSLCGSPFLSGFYSKDYIVESILNENFSLKSLIFVLFMFSTLVYMSRLMKIMSKISFFPYNLTGCQIGMIKPMFILMAFSSFSGSLMSWLIVSFNSTSLLEKMFVLLLTFIVPIMIWNFPQINFPLASQMLYILPTFKFLSISFFKILFNYNLILEKPGFLSFIHSTKINKLSVNSNISLILMLELLGSFFLLISILFNSTVNNSLPLFWL